MLSFAAKAASGISNKSQTGALYCKKPWNVPRKRLWLFLFFLSTATALKQTSTECLLMYARMLPAFRRRAPKAGFLNSESLTCPRVSQRKVMMNMTKFPPSNVLAGHAVVYCSVWMAVSFSYDWKHRQTHVDGHVRMRARTSRCNRHHQRDKRV